jgi:glyoxylate/hydroxypyruvate reductase A
MAILYAAEQEGANALFQFLTREEPGVQIDTWPNVGSIGQIEFAVVGGELAVDLRQFPALRAIQSTWAGVNALLQSPNLPPGVPVARMVAHEMTGWMTEYVVFHVLDIFRQGGQLRAAQASHSWIEEDSLHRKPRIGILGLGVLGRLVADRLSQLGFSVSGWTRGRGGVSYAPSVGLVSFLAGSDILVCLLPLTEETNGFLNDRLFSVLPAGASIIQVGRGAQMVEADLLGHLNSGHLSQAVIDVFAEEPLPTSHAFWKHPHITVTPHVAAISRAGMGATLILDNYRRTKTGKPLLYEVDRARGY